MVLRTLARERHPLAAAKAQIELLRGVRDVPAFAARVAGAGHGMLRRGDLRVLQINVGKLCNQTCRHCHVDAGPDRREMMTRETMHACLRAVDLCPTIETIDVTGGAPEMNPHFRWLVGEARRRGLRVIDRCNLTILTVPAYEWLADFLAEQGVEIVASLPSFLAERTDAQRGGGVFEKSIAALRMLNERGYGRGAGRGEEPLPNGRGSDRNERGSDRNGRGSVRTGCRADRAELRLNLVYNPTGAFLPGQQASLEAEYRRVLRSRHTVEFDRLFTITNLPIGRFLEYLELSGNLDEYLQKLHVAFNPATLAGVMCRETLSVGWDGRLYDCDFNQMLEIGVNQGQPPRIEDFTATRFDCGEIAVGQHCYGCTAGAGSSCGGAVV